MDPARAPDLEPTPDLTPFFSDFKNAKKNIFKKIFSYNLPSGTLSSVLKINFLLKFLRALFQCAQHLYEKREWPGAGSGSPAQQGSDIFSHSSSLLRWAGPDLPGGGLPPSLPGPQHASRQVLHDFTLHLCYWQRFEMYNTSDLIMD